MRRMLLIVLALSLAIAGVAQKKKKSDLPLAVAAAQFVYITSFHGDTFDRNTNPEDRDAINRVEAAVRQWKRYRIVYHPDEADLMLVVKPGAIASARIGIDTGIPPITVGPNGGRVDTRPRGGSGGVMTGGEVGNTPDDMLLVSLQPQEPADMASFIWRRSAHNGLLGKNPALIEEFRKAVAESEQQNAKKP